MKFYFFIIVFLSSFSVFGNPKLEVIIKYSANDCAVCNVPLSQVKMLPKGIEKKIVFSSDLFGSEEISYAVDICTENNFSIVYSDSLLNAFDSSQRSTLYILKDDKIIFKNYLKSIDFKELAKLIESKFALEGKNENVGNQSSINTNTFQSKSKQTNTDFLRRIIATSDFINILYLKKGLIVRLKKEDLNNIFDTINLNKTEYIEKIYSSKYASNYKAKIEQYFKYCKEHKLPTIVFNANSFYRDGENLVVQLSFRNIETNDIDSQVAISGGVSISNSSALLTINSEKQIIDSKSCSTKEEESGYQLAAGCYYKNAGKVVLAVTRRNLSDTNYLLAETKLVDNTYFIERVIPVYLSNTNIKTGMGYSMGSYCIVRDSFLAIQYDNHLYNTRTHFKYEFPFYMEDSNNDTVKSINFYKLKSNIMSFDVDLNHRINVFYVSNDSCYFAHCEFSKDKLILLNKKFLFNQSYSHEMMATQKGVYFFIKPEGRFEYKSYNKL